MTIELNSITSGYSVSLVNANFQKLEKYLNESLLNRANVGAGQPNQMEVALDMNGNSILNVNVDEGDINSLLTIAVADERYVDVTGDTLQGPLSMNSNPIHVRVAQDLDEPARKEELDTERSARIARDLSLEAGYTSADANIQQQLTGNVPLESSAFSPISWHKQVVENSVTIPDNQNGWSFGPTVTLTTGTTLTVGTNSFYTVADGEAIEEDTIVNLGSAYSATDVTVTNSTLGTDAILASASPTTAGVLSAADKAKLNGIEAAATADQTASEIKTLYESNTNTNAYTDGEKSKLTGIEVGATADQTAGEIKTAYESNTNTNAFTDAYQTKLAGIEAGAEVNDPTNLTTSYGTTSVTVNSSTGTNTPINSASGTLAGVMTASDKSKLDSVEAGADVSDPTNLSTTYTSSTVSVNSSTGTNTVINGATTAAAGVMLASDKLKLNGIESGATADQTASEIKTAYESNTNTNAYTDSEKTKLAGIEAGAQVNVGTDLSTSYSSTAITIASSTGTNTGVNAATTILSGVMSAPDKAKLNGIESGATADQTASEIKTLYESNTNTNAFTDVEKSRVADLNSDTGWISLTLQNSWVNFGSGYQTPRVRRNAAGMVSVQGMISSGSIATGTVICNLPAGFRPSATLRVSLIEATNENIGVNIETNGNITAQSLTTNAWVSLSFVFQL